MCLEFIAWTSFLSLLYFLARGNMNEQPHLSTAATRATHTPHLPYHDGPKP